MANSVMIKSYKGGLSVHLDPGADMDTIREDLAEKFRESAKFFKDATVAISFEDREIDSFTERDLVNIITANSSLNIACIAGHNKPTQTMILNALNELEYKSELNKDSSVQIIRDTVKDGSVIDVPGSILILGDVYQGSTVIAGGDIFVIGNLYGQACAGNDGDTERIIVALDMNPEKMRISGIKYKPAEKGKWGIKNKVTGPRMARLEGTEITLSVLDTGFWKKFHYGP